MLELIDNGWKLNQIGGNTGVYVATRGQQSIVYTTNWADELVRSSGSFRSEAAATAEAEAIISDRKLADRELAFV